MSKSNEKFSYSHLPTRGVRSILAIDDDENILSVYETAIEAKGYRPVLIHDGITALEAVENFQFSLILLDWKIPRMTGFTILNRIRQSKLNKFTPVIIISGYANKEKFDGVSEFPLTFRMGKPVQIRFLEKLIKNGVSKQKKFLDVRNSIMKQIRSISDDNLIQTYEQLATKIKGNESGAHLLAAVAYQLKDNGHPKAAIRLLLCIIRDFQDCLLAYTELGKLYLERGDFEKAIATLSQAHRKSPGNYERICCIGDAALLMYDLDSAAKYYKQCKNEDPFNQKYECRLEIVERLKIISDFDFSDVNNESLYRFLVSVGAKLSKSGNLNDSEAHYKDIFRLLDRPQEKAQLAYNMAIGYLRNKRTTQAILWFKEAAEFSEIHENTDVLDLSLKMLDKIGQNPDKYRITAREYNKTMQMNSTEAESFLQTQYQKKQANEKIKKMVS